MAGQQLVIPINNPGIYGLNKEDQFSLLDPRWATTARNCILDEANRLVSREGWTSEDRENLLLYSEQFDNAAWLKASSGTGVDPVVTANAAAAPDGSMTADKIVFDSGAGTAVGDYSQLIQGITIPDQAIGALWLRGDVGGEEIVIRFGDGGEYILATLTTSWQQFIDPGSGGGVAVGFGIRQGLGGFESINSTATIYAWGAQLNEGATLDEYVETQGTVSSGVPTSSAVKAFFEYRDESDNTYYVFAANNKLFSFDKSTGFTTDITGTVAPTADNWKFQNFNGNVVGFQAGHDPIIWSGTGDFQTIVATTGTLPQANEVLAAYGRLWTVEGTLVKYSDLLIETAWDSGSSGVIDLSAVWVYGQDEGIALAAFNGYLIIFGRNSILIYANPDNPFNMQLVESINGIGCIARDSVQILGTDLWFLHDSGLHSLGRVVQEKSLPETEISRNIRSYLQEFIQSETPIDIKSVYVPEKNFYLLAFPSAEVVFCFDTRNAATPTGGKRVTTWKMAPYSMARTEDGELYLGFEGAVGKYGGYNDNDTEPYSYYYTSGWISPPDQFQGRQMIFKTCRTIFIVQGDFTVDINWEFDFGISPYTRTVTADGKAVAEYGTAEYNIAEYGQSSSLRLKQFATAGAGQYLQINFTTEIDGNKFGLQKLDLKTKIGRIA